MKSLLATATAVAALAGCGDKTASSHEVATTVFTNAKVYTVNEKQPWAEAVAIKDNKIVYVGDSAGVKDFVAEGTETLDLQGKMLLPGFVSGHDHLVAGEWLTYGVNLYGATNKEETLQAIKDYVAAHPDEEAYVGIGWNDALLGDWPTAKELDGIIADKPAILLDYTGHAGWVNTKAMAMAGVDKNTPDPIPGVSYFKRDAEGNPTGASIEWAWSQIYAKSGAWKPETMIPDSQKNLYGAAVKAGYTTTMVPGIVTPNIMYADKMFADYRVAMKYLHELEEKGELSLRSMILPIFKRPDTDTDKFVKDTLALKKQYDSDMLRIDGIKVHSESSWPSKAVKMVEPFANDPGNTGIANIDGNKMHEIILAANAAGLDVHTHLEGDGSARNWIDAIEASRTAGNKDERNSIQHMFHITPSDLERVKLMDIPVNVSPLFSTAWAGQDVAFHEVIGDERVQAEVSMYPELFKNGNKVSMSTDIPCAPIEYIGPLANIQTAMTHKEPFNPEAKAYPANRQGISLEDGIKSVTINAAWQMRMEDKIGSLEVGKYADFVVLEQNLFDVPVQDIHSVKVMGTMLNGKFTHRDGI